MSRNPSPCERYSERCERWCHSLFRTTDVGQGSSNNVWGCLSSVPWFSISISLCVQESSIAARVRKTVQSGVRWPGIDSYSRLPACWTAQVHRGGRPESPWMHPLRRRQSCWQQQVSVLNEISPWPELISVSFYVWICNFGKWRKTCRGDKNRLELGFFFEHLSAHTFKVKGECRIALVHMEWYYLALLANTTNCHCCGGPRTTTLFSVWPNCTNVTSPSGKHTGWGDFLFSLAGNTIVRQHSSLHDGHVDALLILHANQDGKANTMTEIVTKQQCCFWQLFQL